MKITKVEQSMIADFARGACMECKVAIMTGCLPTVRLTRASRVIATLVKLSARHWELETGVGYVQSEGAPGEITLTYRLGQLARIMGTAD